MTKEYVEYRAPFSGVMPEDMPEEKKEQRLEAVNTIKHKTILELYAGDGSLSKEVYKGKANRYVLVDEEAKSIGIAKRRMAGMNADFYVMNNKKFIDEELEKYDDITLVDFDPYGTPALTIQHFFEKYKVNHPMVVSITDGITMAQAHMNWENVKWKEKYLLDKDMIPASNEDVAGYITNLMSKLGKKYGFKIEKINGVFRKKASAYLTSYLIEPT